MTGMSKVNDIRCLDEDRAVLAQAAPRGEEDLEPADGGGGREGPRGPRPPVRGDAAQGVCMSTENCATKLWLYTV